MNWRKWVYDTLRNASGFTTLVPATSIYLAWSLTTKPEKKPFVVLVFGDDDPQLKGVVSQQNLTVWCHDNPGSYAKIDQVLEVVRGLLVGPVASDGAFMVEWQGDSGDLNDDAMQTVMRNSSYRITQSRRGG